MKDTGFLSAYSGPRVVPGTLQTTSQVSPRGEYFYLHFPENKTPRNQNLQPNYVNCVRKCVQSQTASHGKARTEIPNRKLRSPCHWFPVPGPQSEGGRGRGITRALLISNLNPKERVSAIQVKTKWHHANLAYF